MSVLSDIVAKFRAASPNIAAAFDEVERRLVALEGTPPPPPPSSLPFAEAGLRAGYETIQVPVPETTQITLPAGKDVLLDLQGIRRPQALKVYVRANQRVHCKGAWIDSQLLPGNSRGLSAYWRGGLGFRMVAADTAGAEHVSVTDYLAEGAGLTDGFTVGGTTDTKAIRRVTVQRARIESAALQTGKASVETGEHMDCVHIQGPVDVLEMGLCTLYRQWAPVGSHPGKGMMLNVYGANGNTYKVDLRKVNFRDYPGATGCGAAWIKDDNRVTMNLEDVWSLIEGNPSSSWAWVASSGLFLNSATAGGINQGWTSLGTAPARVASFPSVTGIAGSVKEGLPVGGDFAAA